MKIQTIYAITFLSSLIFSTFTITQTFHVVFVPKTKCEVTLFSVVLSVVFSLKVSYNEIENGSTDISYKSPSSSEVHKIMQVSCQKFLGKTDFDVIASYTSLVMIRSSYRFILSQSCVKSFIL